MIKQMAFLAFAYSLMQTLKLVKQII